MPDPFAENFLEAVAALKELNDALVQIGLGGCREFRDMERAVLDHGAETHRISNPEAD